MEQNGLLKTWTSLSVQQQIVAVAATLATIATFTFLFIQVRKEPEALLFSGLDNAAAGEIAAQLDGMTETYTLKGGAIFVPESKRDRLRVEMARQGLPAASGGGYELLDNLNGFSTTSDMFDAAYWRAKEGELTRTILSIPEVRSARVHLGVTRKSAFRRSSQDKTASVTIDAPRGISGEQAKSIQYLTALAVSDLNPEHVAVIDTARGVITGPGGRADSMMGESAEDRAKALETRILSMLEAHVGYGKARVTVSMDLDRQRIAQTERLIDPDTRQIATRTLNEEQDRTLTADAAGGVVTVASNLPDGDGAEEEADNRMLRTKRNEEVTYTGTQIERITETAAGALKRLSIAVMLDERTLTQEDGTVVPAPRTEQELDSLRALVSNAAGLDEARGDSLALSILPFDRQVLPESIPPGFVDAHVMPNAIQIAQIVFLGLVSLILGLFVVRPLLKGPKIDLAAAEIADDQDALPEDAAELLTMLTEENPDDAAAILDAWFEDEPQQQAV